MPRIAIIDLSFHWPPTGGSWVDIAHIGEGLTGGGADVRFFVPRLDTGGLKRGLLSEPPPVEVDQIPLSLGRFNFLHLPRILRSRVLPWRPDFVVVANTFAMAPWIAGAFCDQRVVLRIYGYEMLCPFYMSLWPHGRVAQWAVTNPKAEICPHNFLSSPGRCTWCALRGIGRELLPKWMNPFSHEFVASGGFLPGYNAAVRRSFDRAYRVLVSNEFTAGMLRRWSAKVAVVPGGVDTDRFRPPDVPVTEPVVLMPGRVEDPRKGYAVFREMVHRLTRGGHDLRALVTDPRYDGNSVHIASLGWVSYGDMPRVLRSARVVVVPTMWPEPFGLVTLEAMACGVPVVAHRIGGLTELVRDGVTGFLVEPGDIDALADRVARLLNDEAMHARYSRAARVHAETFGWDRIVAAHYFDLFGMRTRNSP